MRPKGVRTWVEIDTDAIVSNIQAVRKRIGNVKCAGVVKSNAYGHGMELVAQTAIRAGVEWLCVDELHEAITLRDAGITKPVLVLGHTLPELFEIAVEKDISITISSLHSLGQVSENLKIHLKVDTGMHRQGFLPEEIDGVLSKIKNIEGVYTHFASLDSHTHDAFSQKQLETFTRVLEKIEKQRIKPIVHASASSGTLSSGDFHFDMVRLGVAMYGLWPSQEMKKELSGELELKPVLSWKSIVTEVKTISKGEKIGYGCTFETERETKIAIIPVGYWHGFARGLSNKGHVLVDGMRVPIVGNISMDMTAADVTDIDVVNIYDEVTLIGEDIPAEEMAGHLGTINYEVVTRINPLIPHVQK